MQAHSDQCCLSMNPHGCQNGMSFAGKSLIRLILVALCLCEIALGQDTSFSIYQFSNNESSLSLLGDATIDDLALEITQYSSGRALYKTPIQFTDPSSETSISFATTFIFSIETNVNDPSSAGEGLAFMIAPDNSTIGSAGPWLGLLSSSNDTSTAFADVQSHIVAVEFDVHKDVEFWDINDNHVGVDINSLNSISAKDAQSDAVKVNLQSGQHIQAWVEYDSEAHKLDISISPFVNNNFMKPNQPLLSVNQDLSTVLNQYMFVGFSAATGSGIVHHKVFSWSFQSKVVPFYGSGGISPSPSPYNPNTPGPASDGWSFRATPACRHGMSVAFNLALLLSFLA